MIPVRTSPREPTNSMFQQLREDIACIHQRDPAARSRFEILTCYPGLHALIIHRLAHRLWRARWYWAGRFVSHLGRLLTGIEIHPGARIGRRVFIDHGFGVVIGETAEVGDDCTIYQGVTLGGTRLYKGEKRHPTLEEGVVVGAGAQILGGFIVGAHARIGSNAVVIKPVPAGATAVGNPARVIPPRGTPASEAPPARRPGPCDDPSPAAAATPEPAVWEANALKALLERGSADDSDTAAPPTQATSEPAPERHTDDFAAYGVSRADDDPLIKVLHELIDHTARQDTRIQQLCHALEDLGHRIDNGQHALDAERLNRMVD